MAEINDKDREAMAAIGAILTANRPGVVAVGVEDLRRWAAERDALAAEVADLRAMLSKTADRVDALATEAARLRAVATAAERLLMQVQRTDGWTENYRALAEALAGLDAAEAAGAPG